MSAFTLEAAIFFCAKELAENQEISEEALYDLYLMLELYFETKATVH